MDYQDFISSDPNIRSGRFCLRGTRIAVGDVLARLASGMTENEILDDFPTISREHLKACLAFAAGRDRKTKEITDGTNETTES